MPRIRLPPGFKFQPTDQELILVYLVPNIRENLADDFIKFSDDVYKKPPSEFCTDSTALYGHDNIGKHYFFTRLRRSNRKVVRTVGSCGSWHESKKYNIVNNKVTIGCKRLLNFKLKGEGECNATKTTEWIMHEFSHSSESPDIVLCVIQNKKKDEEKGLGSPLVLGLGWGSGSGSDSGSRRSLTITSVESGSPRSFFDNPDIFEEIYAFPPYYEETTEAERRPGELNDLADDPVIQFDPMSLLRDEPCPAQDEEIQQSMNMGPQCDNDLFSGCSGFIPPTLLNEDAPIHSPEFDQYFN